MSPAADRILASLGASASAGDPAAAGDRTDIAPALSDPVRTSEYDAGLPTGTIEHCTGLALALGALAGAAASGLGVAIQVRLPEVMAAAYGSAFAMRPAPPQPVEGGGWLHSDLGAAGDRSTFDTLVSSLPPSATAAEVAAAAQEWRLPVCDYRSRPGGPPAWPWSFEAGAAPARGPRSRRVLDLTNMWAGPLATWLLRSLGWSVTKVEPAFRPDGFRALDGGGIHPGGVPCAPGRDSAMWNALNHGKEIVDLDLRETADRERFVDLAADSDVVIDSFSPRVMPNFGLTLPEGPLYVSLPAFPPGPARDWVAYGTGIHALSGLGDLGDGRFAAPAVSYPDPVAGFTAALAVVAALAGRERGVPIARVECPLFGAAQPLLRWASRPSPVGSSEDGIGARLLHAGDPLGLFERRSVCGGALAHPAGIFRAKQNVF